MARDAFLAKYRAAAEKISAETGIPVERILAQAGHESGWNDAAPGNNFFGVKAQPGYSGKSQMLDTTEDYGKGLVPVKQSFRVYDSPEDSFRDWAKVLQQDNFKAATQPGIPDAEYAQALKDGGYATDPAYAKKLTGAIADTRRALYGVDGNVPPAPLPASTYVAPGGGIYDADAPPATPTPEPYGPPASAAPGAPGAPPTDPKKKQEWWATMGQAGRDLMQLGAAPTGAPQGLLSPKAYRPQGVNMNFLQSIFG